MEAYELTIEAKVKISGFRIVSTDDFQFQTERAINPRIVLDHPTISLYCLDHPNQQAIFVETPPTVDLLQAPFYFLTQYEQAQRLIAIPYTTLHELASEVQIDPQRIILLYSTGRCGSTLLSHVLNQEPATASFSEPDVFTQLVMLRAADHSNDHAIRTLLHDCLMIMCGNAHQRTRQCWAFKFRSYVLTVSDLLYQVVPEAKILFQYRHPLAWARSFSRAFGMPDEELAELVHYSHRYLLPRIDLYLQTHNRPIPYLDFLASMWISSMQDCRRLQELGASMACARYEDLKVAPRTAIQALLEYCGLPLLDPERLDRVLAADSQAGTVGAHMDAQEPARRLADDDLSELDRLIRQADPTLGPDTILPQTIRP